jgi:trehalose 6-phosphate phosphatase
MLAILGAVSVATHSLDDALAPLRADPSRAAVLLDVDGTLAPIVRHADDAHVPEPTRTQLIAVAKAYGFVACVSGRRAATARRIVSLGSITYVGNHGTEVLRGGATGVEVDEAVAEWAPRVRAFAQSRFAESDELRRLRVRGEDKEVIAAFHWRGAPDEEAAEAAVRALADRAQDEGFAVHWGRKVLEVRPPVAMDKGRGITRLLRDAGMAVGLYAGDDATDLDAFRGLRELVSDGVLQAAVCVGVRSEETPAELEAQADVLVEGPAGVRRLLEALVRR